MFVLAVDHGAVGCSPSASRNISIAWSTQGYGFPAAAGPGCLLSRRAASRRGQMSWPLSAAGRPTPPEARTSGGSGVDRDVAQRLRTANQDLVLGDLTGPDAAVVLHIHGAREHRRLAGAAHSLPAGRRGRQARRIRG